MLHHIFELVTDEKLTLYSSPTQIEELQRKFVELVVREDVQENVLFFINSKAIIIDPTIVIQESRDKEDDFLLELAEATHAEYLITRDNDLLVMKKRKETEIMLPEDFLPLLRKMNVIAVIATPLDYEHSNLI